MNKPLRIALFTYSTKPRGGVIHTLELAEALQDLGQEVCIYALAKDNLGFHRPVKCPTKLVPTKPAPESIDELIKQRIQEFIDYLILEVAQYDIYHSQDCISANALKILRDQGVIANFIRTAHHIDEFNSFYLQQCHDRSIVEPDLCLCVSNYWQQQLQQQYGVGAPVIINGINLDKFDRNQNGLETELKQRLGIRDNPVYLSIGGIEPRKNSLKLLEAYAQVLKIYPQAQLVIAGGDTLFDYKPYRREFFRLVETYNICLGESLILPGVMSEQDLAVLYRCADAFVFPSVKEGWGLVLLEAIASGIPVITSKIAPFTEFLNDNSALLVNPNSSEDLSQAMLEILNPNVAQKLIHNSSNIPLKYSWSRSAQIHLNLYRSFISS
ncbi:MAG: MSMEG_0565 family glycosyltransferase [Cyanobacteria bacterium P01_A01_bin.83]